MATLSGPERDNLPDSDFAYIEPGGTIVDGKTTPPSKRHFPIHDEAHVRNALARIAQGAEFGEEARPKVLEAARKMGIEHDGSDGDGGRSWTDATVERRFLGSHSRSEYHIGDFGLETRKADDGKRHIVGYGAVFNRPSKPIGSAAGGFRERVLPSSSQRNQLEGFPGVVCRYNHNENLLLGTIQGRTLTLTPDRVGMLYDVDPPQSRADVVELVERRDVAHSSFAFRCVHDDWDLDESGYPRRSLVDIDWVDVAPVVTPAYGDATAGLRSLARRFDASEEEVRSLADDGELRKFFMRTDRGYAPPKPKMSGAAALAALMGKREDPLTGLELR